MLLGCFVLGTSHFLARVPDAHHQERQEHPHRGDARHMNALWGTVGEPGDEEIQSCFPLENWQTACHADPWSRILCTFVNYISNLSRLQKVARPSACSPLMAKFWLIAVARSSSGYIGIMEKKMETTTLCRAI